MAPEVLAPDASNPKPFSEVNRKAADMWSFAVVLWEMVTREIPFSDLSPMQCGLKIATESLRVLVPTGTYSQLISQLESVGLTMIRLNSEKFSRL